MSKNSVWGRIILYVYFFSSFVFVMESISWQRDLSLDIMNFMQDNDEQTNASGVVSKKCKAGKKLQ